MWLIQELIVILSFDLFAFKHVNARERSLRKLGNSNFGMDRESSGEIGSDTLSCHSVFQFGNNRARSVKDVNN